MGEKRAAYDTHTHAHIHISIHTHILQFDDLPDQTTIQPPLNGIFLGHEKEMWCS